MLRTCSAIIACVAALLWVQAARAAACERFGDPSSASTVVFLHGAAGAAEYRALAQAWAEKGFFVLYPHFYDATRTTSPSEGNYRAWVGAVADCIHAAAPAGKPVDLFGISLGASVALAAGVTLPGIDAVVDWAGSLPDAYFYRMEKLPPLLILHGDEDANVPVINARQLFTLCERTHTPCEGTIYHHDGHVFPYHRDDAKARTLAFLRARAATPAAAKTQ